MAKDNVLLDMVEPLPGTGEPRTQANVPLAWINPSLAEDLKRILTENYEKGQDYYGTSVAILFGNPDLIPGREKVPGRATVMWQGVAGTANPITGQPITSDMYFDLGSITKNFTAALILKYVERNELDLNERLLTYLKALAQNPKIGTFITLEQLLNMEGGICNYDLELIDNPTGALDECQWTPLATLSQIKPKKYWVPLEKVWLNDWSMENLKENLPEHEFKKLNEMKSEQFNEDEFWKEVERLITPDKAFNYKEIIWRYSIQHYQARYSNTNYLLAGLVLGNMINDDKGVTRLFHEILFKPNHLNQLYFGGDEPPRLPRPIAFSHRNPKSPCINISEYTQAFTTGALNGTASNLAYWFDTLYRRKHILSQAMLDKILKYENAIIRDVNSENHIYYNMGTLFWMVPEADVGDSNFQLTFDRNNPPSGTLIYGHVGSINGFIGLGFHYPAKETTIVLLQNNNGSEETNVALRTFFEIVQILRKKLK